MDNVTIAVLATAKRWIQKNQMTVTVVLGANAPHADEVRAFCSVRDIRLLRERSDGWLMASNDLCIGGNWNLDLGTILPRPASIAVKTADNQHSYR